MDRTPGTPGFGKNVDHIIWVSWIFKRKWLALVFSAICWPVKLSGYMGHPAQCNSDPATWFRSKCSTMYTKPSSSLRPKLSWSQIECCDHLFPNLTFVICLGCGLHEQLNSVNDNGCFHSMPKRPHIQPDFESESCSLMFTCSPVFTCRSVTQLPSGLWKNSFLWSTLVTNIHALDGWFFGGLCLHRLLLRHLPVLVCVIL